jgi:hypothetical protein
VVVGSAVAVVVVIGCLQGVVLTDDNTTHRV